MGGFTAWYLFNRSFRKSEADKTEAKWWEKITYTPGVTLNQTENKYFYILLSYAKGLKIRRIQKQKVAKNSKISIMVKLK